MLEAFRINKANYCWEISHNCASLSHKNKHNANNNNNKDAKNAYIFYNNNNFPSYATIHFSRSIFHCLPWQWTNNSFNNIIRIKYKSKKYIIYNLTIHIFNIPDGFWINNRFYSKINKGSWKLELLLFVTECTDVLK